MSALYLSGWSPRNTPKIWERTSVSNDDAAHVLARYHVRRPDSSPRESVAWFDTRGELRMIVCDMTDNRRITLRLNKAWKLEILPEGALTETIGDPMLKRRVA